MSGRPAPCPPRLTGSSHTRPSTLSSMVSCGSLSCAGISPRTAAGMRPGDLGLPRMLSTVGVTLRGEGWCPGRWDRAGGGRALWSPADWWCRAPGAAWLVTCLGLRVLDGPRDREAVQEAGVSGGRGRNGRLRRVGGARHHPSPLHSLTPGPSAALREDPLLLQLLCWPRALGSFQPVPHLPVGVSSLIPATTLSLDSGTTHGGHGEGPGSAPGQVQQREGSTASSH